MIRQTLIYAAALFCLGAAGCMQNQTGAPQAGVSTLLPLTPLPSSTIDWFPPTQTVTPFIKVTAAASDVAVAASPTFGSLIFEDNFNEPGQWNLSQTKSNSIALGINELTLALNQPGSYLYSLRKEPELEDYYLEITANPTLCRDDDEYGVLFKVISQLDFYRFSITCDGRTRVDRVLNGEASSPQPLIFSGAVPRGAPSASSLAVWVKGKEMRFFINGEYQFSLYDSSIPKGKLGVFARSAGNNAVTVNFSDLSVFEASP